MTTSKNSAYLRRMTKRLPPEDLPWLRSERDRINRISEHKCQIVRHSNGFYALERLNGYYNDVGEWIYTPNEEV